MILGYVGLAVKTNPDPVVFHFSTMDFENIVRRSHLKPEEAEQRRSPFRERKMALDLIDLSSGMFAGWLQGLHQRLKIISVMKKDKRDLTVEG